MFVEADEKRCSNFVCSARNNAHVSFIQNREYPFCFAIFFIAVCALFRRREKGEVKESKSCFPQRKRENRTRIEILACILKKSETPTNQSNIILSCGLSHRQAKDLLGFLHLSNLLENNGEPASYRTTKKGYEFLEYYDGICQLLHAGEMETRIGLESPGRTIFHNNHLTQRK